MATSYIVDAPLVVIRDSEGRDRYLYKGTVVPSDVDREHRKVLVDEGMLVKGDDASEVTPTEEPPADPDDQGNGGDGGTGDGATQPPSPSASKGTWVAYATDESRGDQRMTEDDAKALTRDQLAEKFTA